MIIIINTEVRNIQQVRNLIWDTDKHIKEAMVLFSKNNWNVDYSITQRLYEINLSSSGFDKEGNGQAIIGSSLDGSDQNVRLEIYDWEVAVVLIDVE